MGTASDESARAICTMLQTLFRVIPCVAGYKFFVEVRNVDTRFLLLQLLPFDHEFVNYWALEVLMVLCRCPLIPRNLQQEFVNKHTLLTENMFSCFLDLMTHKTFDLVVNPATSRDSDTNSPSNVQSPVPAVTDATLPISTQQRPQQQQSASVAVAPNPLPTAHIPSQSRKVFASKPNQIQVW